MTANLGEKMHTGKQKEEMHEGRKGQRIPYTIVLRELKVHMNPTKTPWKIPSVRQVRSPVFIYPDPRTDCNLRRD